MAWLLIIILFAGILLSVPVSFAIALSSIVVLFLDPSPALTPWVLVQRTFAGLDSFTILAIPLFLLTAEIMNESGITDRLIKFSYALVGHIRGGLSHVNILVSMVFAGISGSSTADTAGIGSILIPSMVKKGYSKEFSISVTAASSTMGQIIPPSIIAVIYASTVGISVGALFLGGLVPGILIGLSQMLLTVIMANRYNYPREERMPFKEIVLTVLGALPTLLTPIIIIGGIVGGFFTPTEAAVVAASWALVLSFFYRTMTFKKLWKILVHTGKMSSVTILCIGVATVFSYIISYYRIPNAIGAFLTGVTSSPLVFLMLVFLLFMIVGCFMDATPSIIMLAPIVAPIGNTLGVNPVHMGVVVVATMALGLITPPYGLCLLLACQIGKTPLHRVMPMMFWFILLMILVLVVCIVFPDLVLLIPRLIMPDSVK